MTTWLDPLRRALEAAPEPLVFFCRDDDAGWADDRLLRLLDLCARFGVPIDLAVIPQALDSRLAGELRRRAEAAPGAIGLHQHGFAHVNHEPEGRKCEFGPTRPAADQRRDIDLGRQRLAELLGPLLQPVFTPPWNRCTADTGRCLVELGFRLLSRDATAPHLGIAELRELPVRFDWFARRQGIRLSAEEQGESLAGAVAEPGPMGIMFHHAIMDQAEMAAATQLLELLANHEKASARSMWTAPHSSAELTATGGGP